MNRSVGVAALAVLGLCLGLTRTVWAEEKTKTDAADPTKFVMLASAAGLAEVNLGKIAAERLAQLTGADFDRQFMRQMVKDHKEAVSLFESQSKNGRDEDLKALAGKMLPTLRDHLKMAQEMADKGKGSEKR